MVIRVVSWDGTKVHRPRVWHTTTDGGLFFFPREIVIDTRNGTTIDIMCLLSVDRRPGEVYFRTKNHIVRLMARKPWIWIERINSEE